jgi:hypothetical protein
MFNGLNKKIFSRVLRKAVRTVSITEPINLQSESVFTIWKSAVHEMFDRNGKCSCSFGTPLLCFMNLSKRD